MGLKKTKTSAITYLLMLTDGELGKINNSLFITKWIFNLIQPFSNKSSDPLCFTAKFCHI